MSGHPAQTVLFTSLRKAGSLVLSYTLFPKPITLQHLVGGALILFGMYLNDKVGAGGNLFNQQPQVAPRIEQRWVLLIAVGCGMSWQDPLGCLQLAPGPHPTLPHNACRTPALFFSPAQMKKSPSSGGRGIAVGMKAALSLAPASPRSPTDQCRDAGDRRLEDAEAGMGDQGTSTGVGQGRLKGG